MIVLLIVTSLFCNIEILAVTYMCYFLQFSQEPYVVAISPEFRDEELKLGIG